MPPTPSASSSAPLKIHTAPEQSRLAPPPHASAGKPVAAPRFQVMTGRSKRDADVAALGEDGEGEDAEEGDEDDDEDDDDGGGDGKGKGKAKEKARKVKHPNKRNSGSVGRRKISIEYIEDKPRRHVTFTKRKSGLMKKRQAFELSTLTGTDCLVVVVSESGLVYTFATPALKGVTEHRRGKNVLSAALRGELRVEPEGEGDGEGAEGENSARPEMGEHGAQGQMLDPSLGGAGGVSTSSSTGLAPMATSTSFLPSAATDTVSSFPFDNPSSSRSSHQHAPDGAGFEADLPVPPFDFHAHPSGASTGPQHYPAYSLPPPASSPAPFFPPSTSASTAFPALPAPYPPQHHHPDHASPYRPDLTPYARAAQSHAQAFASYQAASQFARVPGYVLPPHQQRRASSSFSAGEVEEAPAAERERERAPKRAKYGAHDFGDAAKEWAGRVQERAARDAGAERAAEVEGEGGERGMERGEAVGKEELEERRRAWREKAAEALRAAKENPSISSFLFAHALSLHAASAVPVPVPSSLLPAGGSSTTGEPWRGYGRVPARSSSSWAGATLGAFQDMCERARIDDVGELEGAVDEFLTRALPTLPAPLSLPTAKQHLIALFDFLDGHGLVDPATHFALVSFRRAGGEATGLLGEDQRRRIREALRGRVGDRGGLEGARGGADGAEKEREEP
ncbi:hypothetical protein JCM1840_003899 [Sporobolomyces johnsonii]